MAETPEMEIARLHGLVDIKFPEKEQKKLDKVEEQSGMFKKLFESFGKGGMAMVTGAAALMGFAMSSKGFQAVLGAFKDIVSMLSDLVFQVLYGPVFRPLVEGFAEAAKDLKDGDIAGAMASSADAIVQALSGLAELVVQAFNNPDVQEAVVDALKVAWDLATQAIGWLVDVLMDPQVQDAFASMVQVAFDNIGKFVGWLTETLKDPKVHNAVGTFLVEGFKAMKGFLGWLAGVLTDEKTIEAFKDMVVGAFEFYVSIGEAFAGVLTSEPVTNAFKSAGETIVNVISAGWRVLRGMFVQIFTHQEMMETWKTIGKTMAGAIASELPFVEEFGGVAGAVGEAAGGVYEWYTRDSIYTTRDSPGDSWNGSG